MKTLVLVRHAKSDWGDPALPDHDRPLNDRGRRDAPRMGALLAERGTRPEVILSSTATRARKTAEAFAAALDLGEGALVLDRRLYGSSPATMLAVLAELDERDERLGEAVEVAVLVAHDPGIAEFAEQLSDGRIDRMPTCAIAEFAFEVDSWSELRGARPSSVRFDRPER